MEDHKAWLKVLNAMKHIQKKKVLLGREASRGMRGQRKLK